MFTPEEMNIITPEAAREAINRVFEGMAGDDGRLDVGNLEPVQIDYAIHSLRVWKTLGRG